MSEARPGPLTAVPLGAVPDPEVGQIWTAQPDRGDELHVLVTEVHEDYVPCTSTRCGRPVVMGARTASVSVAQSHSSSHRSTWDIAGSILKRRLSRVAGEIDPRVAERIALRGRGFDLNSRDLGRGPTIVTESDPCWEWKLERHRQMRAVRARARELGLQIHKLGPREG